MATDSMRIHNDDNDATSNLDQPNKNRDDIRLTCQSGYACYLSYMISFINLPVHMIFNLCDYMEHTKNFFMLKLDEKEDQFLITIESTI